MYYSLQMFAAPPCDQFPLASSNPGSCAKEWLWHWQIYVVIDRPQTTERRTSGSEDETSPVAESYGITDFFQLLSTCFNLFQPFTSFHFHSISQCDMCMNVNVHNASWCIMMHLSGVQNWRPTLPSFGHVHVNLQRSAKRWSQKRFVHTLRVSFFVTCKSSPPSDLCPTTDCYHVSWGFNWRFQGYP